MLEITLKQWIAQIILFSWVAILVLRPHLYDEERHLLFLYPPLFVAAALGFDRMRERFKVAMGIVIIAISLFSYASWGRYAYAYKSPLIGSRAADRFMGDYRSACVPEAVDALQGRVGADIPIVIYEHGPLENAAIQEHRRTTSLVARTPGQLHQFLSDPPTKKPYAVLIHQSVNRFPDVMTDINAGRAELLWKNMMPLGDIACAIALYR